MLLNFLMKKWRDVHVVAMVTTITNITIIMNIITTVIVKKTLVDVIITTNTIITTAIAKKTANAQTKKESAIVEINANVMMTITADAKLTNNHPKKIKRSLILTSFFNDKIFLLEKEFSGLDLDNLFLGQVLKEQACDQNSEFPPLLYHKEL